jgi:hypothetical protein
MKKTQFRFFYHMCLLASLMFVLVGCVTTNPITMNMVNAEIMTKQAITTSAFAVSVSCQQGIMSVENCIMASQSYILAQVGTSTILQMMLINCTDESVIARIKEELAAGYPIFSFDPILK